MLERQRGFTLIEMVIVITVIAVIVSIAVPNLLSSRISANERSAIATLKSIATAQTQVQAFGVIDVNGNGTGEFGYFAELAGSVGLRDSSGSPGAKLLRPPVLSAAFGNVTNQPTMLGGVVTHSGYMFQMFLPHALKLGIPEGNTGGVGPSPPDPDQSEALWSCYAWPTVFGSSGSRVFFVHHRGEVLATRNTVQRYSGATTVPRYWSAFALGQKLLMAGTVAVNTTAWDNAVWVLVN